MASSSGSIDLGRPSWRSPTAAGGGTRRKRWRRRVIALAVLMSLAALWALAVFRPFWHPQTHLVLLGATDYSPLAAPPLAYLEEDFAAFQTLRPALGVDSDDAIQPLPFDRREDLAELKGRLRRAVADGAEVVMVFTAAHGVSVAGEPYLLSSDYGKPSGAGGRIPFRETLDALVQSGAKAKVLFVDAGQAAADTRLGLGAGDFPRLVQREVEAVGDPALWVFTACDVFQQSHVSAAMRRSVFSYFLVQGLRGAADADGDRIVDLDELHRFLAANVRAFASGAVGAPQTPRLFWSGGATDRREAPILLSVDRLHDAAAGETVSDAIAAARNATGRSYAGYYAPTAGELTRRIASNALPSSLTNKLSQGSRLRAQAPRSGIAQPSATSAPAEEAASATDPTPGDVPPRTGAAKNDSDGSAPKSNEAAAPSAQAASAQHSGAAVASTPGENTTGSAPATPASPAQKESEQIAAMLAEAWMLREELLDAEGNLAWRPLDAAPHLWRAFEEQLIAQEAIFRTGAGQSDDQAAQLSQMLAPLRDWALLATDPGAVNGLASSSRQPRWQEYAPLVAPANAAPPSLAAQLQLARIPGRAAPEALTKIADALQRFTTEGTRDEFLTWSAALTSDEARFLEVAFAQRLALLADVEWPVLQDALRLHLIAAEAVAVEPELTPWMKTRIAAADRLARAANRELFDRVGPSWRSRVAALQREAVAGYESAEQDARAVRVARRVEHDVLNLAPHYVRWFALGRMSLGGRALATDFEELRTLFVLLGDLGRMLDAPNSHRADEVQMLAQRLSALRARVETRFNAEAIESLASSPTTVGEALVGERLLATALPTAADRLRLAQSLPQVDAAVADRYGIILYSDPPSPPLAPSEDDWRGLGYVLQLQMALARLAAPPALADEDASARPIERALLGDLADAEAAMSMLVESAEPASDRRLGTVPLAHDERDSARWQAYDAFSTALAAYERRLPEYIEHALSPRELADAAKRDAALQKLRAAVRALRLLPAGHALQAKAAPMLQGLAAAQWRDDWVWRRQRLLQGVDDAPEAELAELRDAAHAYRLLAEAIAPLPSIPTRERPQLTLETPTTLALSPAAPQVFETTLQLEGAPQTAVWLMLKYDPQLLAVQITPEDHAVREHELTPASENYPLRPDRDGTPATFVVRAGQKRTLRLRVTAVGASGSPTRLILKAIAAAAEPPQGEADGLLAYVRKTIEVTLPLPQTLDLVVRGHPGAWTPLDDGYRFHPFPNRVTEYRLGLSNRLSRQRRVDVEFAVTTQPVPESLPPGELLPAEAQRWSDRFAPSSSVARIENLVLPANASWVPLPFPPPIEEKPAEPDGAAAAPPPPPVSTVAADVQATAFSAPVAVPREVLVRVTDRETGRLSMLRLAITPQRPRRFVRPEVSYDRDEERVVVRVAADDPALLPPGGARVRCEFAPPLSPSAEARLEGQVNDAEHPAVLYAELPARGPETTLYIHVDDFPRAFIYRIDPAHSRRNLPEDTDALAARLIALPQGTKYPAPAPAFPATVEIDAPPGSFQNADDVVEIGVDKDRDREFIGDAPLTFASDRQVTATLERVAPEGVMALAARVGDFQVNLPDPGLRNAKANVLAHVVAGGREAWSLPVEILFDAGPPLVKKLELTPGRQAALGSELDVRVWCEDHQLSGVAKVEAALDTDRNGQIPAEPPPVAAAPGDRGQWTAKLPLAKPGVYTLLLRVTDEVGNAHILPQGKVHIITPEELAADQSAKFNRVAGVVVYGDQPQPGIEVQLESEAGQVLGPLRTNDQGAFEFPRVPIGPHKITASGLVRGAQRVYPHEGEGEVINVEPPPKVVPALRLPLKTSRRR